MCVRVHAHTCNTTLQERGREREREREREKGGGRGGGRERGRARDSATTSTHPDTDMDKGRQPGETNNSASISGHVGAGMQGAVSGVSALPRTFLRALARAQERKKILSPSPRKRMARVDKGAWNKRTRHGTRGCHALQQEVATRCSNRFACVVAETHAGAKEARGRKKRGRSPREEENTEAENTEEEHAEGGWCEDGGRKVTGRRKSATPGIEKESSKRRARQASATCQVRA